VGSSPVTINPVTGKPQVLGADGLPVPGANTPGVSSGQQTGFSGLQNAPVAPGITAPGAPTVAGSTSYNPTTINPNSLAQVNPTMYGGTTEAPTATQNLGQVSGIANSGTPDLSSNATIQQLLSGFQPQVTEQNGQLAQQLAQFGLSGGPAVAAQNNLDVQQTQAEAPSIASAIQNSQSNQLNQAQFGSTAQLNALNANQSATNATNQAQASLNQQTGLANQDASNTANTANVGAQNATLAANTSAQNAAQQAYLQQLQSQWLDQFSAYNSINDAGLGAQNQISVSGAQDYPVPSTSSPYSGLSSAISSITAPTAKTAATTTA
jgi:hypothetical protein